LPFDLVEATFLAPYEAESYSTADLIANRARQLQKRPEDLQLIHNRVLKSCFASAKDFISRFEKTIHDFDFEPELDGTISKFRFAAFRLFPYFPRNKSQIEVTHLVGLDNPTIDRLEDDSLPDPELTGVLRDESDE
ncbi:hypothetical protein PISMIDRAFT_16999, partial [Pisolithus microcarpus 441]